MELLSNVVGIPFSPPGDQAAVVASWRSCMVLPGHHRRPLRAVGGDSPRTRRPGPGVARRRGASEGSGQEFWRRSFIGSAGAWKTGYSSSMRSSSWLCETGCTSLLPLAKRPGSGAPRGDPPAGPHRPPANIASPTVQRGSRFEWPLAAPQRTAPRCLRASVVAQGAPTWLLCPPSSDAGSPPSGQGRAHGQDC